MTKKIFVLALDGVPYSLLSKLFEYGIMPNFKQLVNNQNFRTMNSVHPPISSVAWTSFMTGKNPAGHNIYGFIEREPETMEVFVPTSINIKSKTIWEYLSELGKRVFTINVPVTYPPKKINGISICGFLGIDILKGTYPVHIGKQLLEDGYQIDVDTVKARTDLQGFIKELNYVFDKRIETIQKFYDQENWDFFMAHIMATDRLHHFVWEFVEENDPLWTEQFYNIYKKIDTFIGILLNKIPQNDELIILSDHGFTKLKKEVYINKWLYDNNYLKFTTQQPPENLTDIHPTSKAYSLIPGRIYINLKGREKTGSVLPGLEYEKIREELRINLKEIKDSDTGEKVVDDVLTREELYCTNQGLNFDIDSTDTFNKNNPYYYAPDLMIIGKYGYDFKGNLWMDKLMDKGPIVGTHTFNDAFLYVRNNKITDKEISIIDLLPTIFELYDLKIPDNFDGKSVLQNRN
jgi:predicted AlkP superfamily phosphohydrolase/phosphomutase